FAPVVSPLFGRETGTIDTSPIPADLVGVAKLIETGLVQAAPASHSGATAHLLGQHLPRDAGERRPVRHPRTSSALGLCRLLGEQRFGSTGRQGQVACPYTSLSQTSFYSFDRHSKGLEQAS